MNRWNLWKLGASRFHLQLASLLFSNLAWGLALDQRAARYVLGQRRTKAKALIKHGDEVKKITLVQGLSLIHI